MKAFLKIFAIVIIFISCSQPGNEEKLPTKDSIPLIKKEDGLSIDHFKVIGDSAEIPSFEIEVELSEKAEKELKNKKESIIVAAYFSGIPTDTTKYMEDGEYAIGTHNIELTNTGTAKFEKIKISKNMYESLASKDIQVLINIYSGRRSSNMNLLDCDILQKPISQVRDQKFILKGKLIGE